MNPPLHRGRAPRLARSVFAAVVACAASAAPAAAARVTGLVLDAGGRPIPVAIVTLRGGEIEAKAPTDLKGRFAVDWDGPDEVRVSVEADGFAARRETVHLAAHQDTLEFELWPVAFAEELTITASRRLAPAGETATSVAVLTADELRATAAPTHEEALRQVPGFTLFRRTTSRYANPTTMGASLRGIGGTAASRALVLDDGIPVNDAFGGWVYWSRVPRATVEQVEVVRGGASALYGSGALAGVVQFVRRSGEERQLDLEGSAGTLRTVQGSLFGQASQDDWAIRVAVETLRTRGYVPLEAARRGPIDDRLRSSYLTEELTLEHRWDSGTRAFLRGSIYGDTRHNGTRLTANEAEIKQGALGLDHPLGAGRFAIRLHGTDYYYEQTFTLVEPDRRVEHPLSEQQVPAGSRGASLQWSRGIGGGRWMVLGADHLRVHARSDEIPFLGQARESVEGRQSLSGAYGDLTLGLGRRGTLSGGARVDQWRNGDAERVVGTRTTTLDGRTQKAVSPRGALLFRLSSWLAVTASAYRAFRAPTLNELYRTFRVGSITTLANEGLDPERLRGREAGLILSGGAFSLRGTYYDMRVDDPITNRTVATTPEIVRRRDNLGRTRTRGTEVDAEVRRGRFSLGAAFLRAHARVTEFDADRTLEGLHVPQVPRDQVTGQVRYLSPGGFTLGVQGRWSSAQFDDDRNQLRLASARVVDAFLAVPVGDSASFFVSGENLTGERIELARTPLLMLGPPRTVRGGVRIRALRPEGARR